MKKYYTKQARESAVKRITELIDVVMTARGDVINYLDAGAIVEILAEGINSKEEALEKATEIQNQFTSYDVVRVESYSQTISANIGEINESITVYGVGR